MAERKRLTHQYEQVTKVLRDLADFAAEEAGDLDRSLSDEELELYADAIVSVFTDSAE